MIVQFRIARGDVSRHAFAEAEFCKQTKCGGEALFAVQAFFGGCGERGRVGSGGDLDFGCESFRRHENLDRAVQIGWTSGGSGSRSGWQGSSMTNEAPGADPLPSGALTVMVPPCLSMISLLTHRPRPVPMSFLVVENGSKIRERCSGATPGPSSSITS